MGSAALDLAAALGLLDAIVQANPDPMFVKDADGVYLLANAATAEALQVDGVAALIGRRDADLSQKSAAEIAQSSDATVLATNAPVSVEVELGGRKLICRKTPWRDAEGKAIGVIGFVSSIVAGDNRELLDLAEEAAHVGLFEWQVQIGTVRFSPKFQALYGLTDFDGRYESWLRYVYREDRPRVAHLIETVFAAQDREIQVEFRIVDGNDNSLKWMEARGVAFYDDAGQPGRVVGVNVDITERKRLAIQQRAFTEMLEDRVRERTQALEAENEARKAAEESLRQSQKMEVVGQLTGGVAHDFNNLLTIVLGGLDLIGRQIPELKPSVATSRIARAREMALQGVQRAATLTQRLLAFSRQQPLAPRPIDPNKLVTDISELLRRTLGEGVSLETVLAGGLWRANADANQLENVLLNLALNARDAMPDGGKVTIEVANSYLDEAYVAALPEPVKAGQYVMIAVADTGFGMQPETLERVFEPFFTTKEVGKGTGLGLSQVYGFMRQSFGHVKIYSEPGQGTTVKIYLPRYIGNLDEADAVKDIGSERHAVGVETILVVEDEAALRAYSVEILTELGYQVLEAPNGDMALGIVDTGHEIDLLFTDVVMPGTLNGRQLADEARRRRPGLKVLYTTGYTRNAIFHHGRLDAGVEIIGKPFSFDDLATKVRAMLDAKN